MIGRIARSMLAILALALGAQAARTIHLTEKQLDVLSPGRAARRSLQMTTQPVLPTVDVPKVPGPVLFIPHEHNLAVTIQSLNCLFKDTWSDLPNVVVIDNSNNFEAIEGLKDYNVTVVPVLIRLQFPDFQNLFAVLAHNWGLATYAYAQGDSCVLPFEHGMSMNNFLARRVQLASADWGSIFIKDRFGHPDDLFCIYKTEAVLDVRWDQHFLQGYHADCDFMARMRQHGYKLEYIIKPAHMIHVYHPLGVHAALRHDVPLEEKVRVMDGLMESYDRAGGRPGSGLWKQLGGLVHQISEMRGRQGEAYMRMKWGQIYSSCFGMQNARPRETNVPILLPGWNNKKKYGQG